MCCQRLSLVVRIIHRCIISARSTGFNQAMVAHDLSGSSHKTPMHYLGRVTSHQCIIWVESQVTNALSGSSHKSPMHYLGRVTSHHCRMKRHTHSRFKGMLPNKCNFHYLTSNSVLNKYRYLIYILNVNT